MNEVLRILDRALKKSGYTIKKHSEYNLLPLHNFNELVHQKKTYDAFNSHEKKGSSNLDSLTICLRTCINKKRAKAKRNELTGVNIEEHLLRCIKSLILSAQYAHENKSNIKLVIFDDRSDEETLEKIKTLCKKSTLDWNIITTKKTGQGASLHQNFSYAKEGEGIYYFCEDDYLHTKTAVLEMINFYKNIYTQTDSHMMLYPQEHEIVFGQFNYPSYILYSDKRRWRTISHATHTFFIHSDVVREYWKYFENTKYVGIKEKRHLGSEKKTTDQLFNHILGFSPIPAIAIHLQTEHCLPPFFDWQELWNSIEQ
jgi:glycosyl transferase family 2